MTAKRSPARRAALYGLLVAAAFIFGYLESLLPSVGVPGIKLGLANLVTVVVLYRLRAADAAGVALLRILLSGLTFGSPAAMLYALAGGICSLAAMVPCRRSGRFSVIGVSMAGAGAAGRGGGRAAHVARGMVSAGAAAVRSADRCTDRCGGDGAAAPSAGRPGRERRKIMLAFLPDLWYPIIIPVL